MTMTNSSKACSPRSSRRSTATAASSTSRRSRRTCARTSPRDFHGHRRDRARPAKRRCSTPTNARRSSTPRARWFRATSRSIVGTGAESTRTCLAADARRRRARRGCGARRRAALLRAGDDGGRASCALPPCRGREPGARHAVQHSQVHALLHSAAPSLPNWRRMRTSSGIKDSSGQPRPCFASYLPVAVADISRCSRGTRGFSSTRSPVAPGRNPRRGVVRDRRSRSRSTI